MEQPVDLFNVSGKVALVTGAASGIGLMIARGLVERGVRTYISSRDFRRCARVAAELSGPAQCTAIELDLQKPASIELAVETLSKSESRLDILVNNAGSLHIEKLNDFTEAAWDNDMQVNVKAAFFLTQKALPLLRAAASPSNPARVINIGSIGGLHVSDTENYAYIASKAAIHHLTRALGRRLGREHITVNTLAPGPFPSDMLNKMVPNAENAAEIVSRHIPRGRLGEAADLVGAVVFLASQAGSYVCGATIPIDGGITGSL
jgi:NAD(P)-dependent dehydrogenase (short-subunit alcohol dehydrogenase family)